MSPALAAAAQALALAAVLALAVPLLGRHLAHTYTSPTHLRVERWAYRALRIDPDADQRARTYTLSVLGFSLVSIVALYALARLQPLLPLSGGRPALPADGAWNTAVSFATNTNWQWYSGEQVAGDLLQTVGLGVQNFTSAAVGMAVAAALARSLAGGTGGTGGTGRGGLGSFWVDLVRGTVRVLLPLALVAAVALAGLGVMQSLAGTRTVTTLDGGVQHVPGGLVASQEAIKQLGTNGGGFFNANSAHPFENPTPFTSLLAIVLMLLVPFAMAWAFGLIVGDRRQGAAVVATMAILLTVAIALLTWAELAGHGSAPVAAGAAMEGKEVRFGAAGSALFAAATTGTSTGAVNASHDSLTAPGGGVAMFMMLLGEIAPGGVGTGLVGLLLLAVLTVFLAGLMTGRTPQYLGRRIGHREVVLIAVYVLTAPFLVLIGLAIALSAPAGLAGLQETGPHGLSEALYAIASAANNNGSAFAGLSSGTPFWNTLLGVAMLLGRLAPLVIALALAGRFAAAPRAADGPGTWRTHTPLFVGLLSATAVVVVGLTFVPVLVLGPVVEALS